VIGIMDRAAAMARDFRNTDERLDTALGSTGAADARAPSQTIGNGVDPNERLLPLSYLVAAFFCFAWRSFDGIVLRLGHLPVAVVGVSPSRGETMSARRIFRDVGASRQRSLALAVFAIGVAAGALGRAVELAAGGSMSHAATDLERWGVLLLTLSILAVYAMDGLIHRSPRHIAVGVLGLAIAFAASWLGLAWKDALALTFAGLALLTAIAAVSPEPQA
jgi:hypothetical protein